MPDMGLFDDLLPTREAPDYTERYNTALAAQDEDAYRQWLAAQSAAMGRDIGKDNFDYDMRGAFTAGISPADNGHFPDTFKKPNHPTFSDQSQYHGADGHQGGSWVKVNDTWHFTPGKTNVDTHGEGGIRQYLNRGDPGVQLNMPATPGLFDDLIPPPGEETPVQPQGAFGPRASTEDVPWWRQQLRAGIENLYGGLMGSGASSALSEIQRMERIRDGLESPEYSPTGAPVQDSLAGFADLPAERQNALIEEYRQRAGEGVAAGARSRAFTASLPRDPAMKPFEDAQGMSKLWPLFTDPSVFSAVMQDALVTGAPTMAVPMALSVLPGIGPVAAGVGYGAQQYGGRFQDVLAAELAKDKVDIRDPAAVSAWLQANPARANNIQNTARTAATIEGAAQTAMFGLPKVLPATSVATAIAQGFGTAGVATLGTVGADYVAHGEVNGDNTLSSFAINLPLALAMSAMGMKVPPRQIPLNFKPEPLGPEPLALRGTVGTPEAPVVPGGPAATPVVPAEPVAPLALPAPPRALPAPIAPLPSPVPPEAPMAAPGSVIPLGRPEAPIAAPGSVIPLPPGAGAPVPTGSGTPLPTGSGTPLPTGSGTPVPTGSGTPVPTGETTIDTSSTVVSPPSGVTSNEAITPTGARVPVQYELSHIDDLVAASGDLQPRDRAGRIDSERQIAKIKAEFDPVQVIHGPYAERGPPIVGPDDMVEGGNGRTEAMRQLLQEAAQGDVESQRKMDAYYDALRAAGYQPKYGEILIRRRQGDLTPEQRRQLANDLNAPTGMARSEPELAKSDAHLITTNMLDTYSAANPTEFATQLIAKLPFNEHNTLMTGTGELSNTGQRRVRNALLARAYDNDVILNRYVDSRNPDLKGFGNALVDASPAWARLRDAAKSGDIAKSMDVTDDLVRAMDVTSAARAGGIEAEHALAQAQTDMMNRLSPAGAELMRALYNPGMKRLASGERVGQILKDYARLAMEQRAAGTDMFGGSTVTPEALIKQAREKVQAGAEDTQGGLFTPAGKPAAQPKPSTAPAPEPVSEPAKRVVSRKVPAKKPPALKDEAVATPGEDDGRVGTDARVRPIYPNARDVPQHRGDINAGSMRDEPFEERLSNVAEPISAKDLALTDLGEAYQAAAIILPDGRIYRFRDDAYDYENSHQEFALEYPSANFAELTSYGGEVAIRAYAPTAEMFRSITAYRNHAVREGANVKVALGPDGVDPFIGHGGEAADAVAESGQPTPLHDATLAAMDDPTHNQASKSNRVSIQMHAFTDAGVDPHEAVLWTPAKQYRTIRDMLLKRYGFKDVLVDKGINWRHALDQSLDAYANIQWLMYASGMTEAGASLSGRITLLFGASTNARSPLGTYNPNTRTIRLNDRANSFAHEWMHALDHMLIEALGSGLGTGQLASRRILARGPGNAANLNTDTTEAFSHLLTTLFTDDKAGLAKQMFSLQQQAAAVDRLGRPTKAAAAARKQIEQLISQHASDMLKGGSMFAPASYWTDPAEMLARAGEAWLAHNMAALGITDHAMVSKGDRAYLTTSDVALKNLYPKDTQRNLIFAAFNTMRNAMIRDMILGNGQVGSAPRGSTDADILNPENWKGQPPPTRDRGTIALLRRLGRGATADARWIYHAMTAPRSFAREVSQNMGWDINTPANKNVPSRIERFQDNTHRMLVGSIGGRMSAIAARQNPAAREFILKIQEDWDGMPGRGRLTSRPHFEEARETISYQYQNKLFAALHDNGLADMNPAENALMMRVLTDQRLRTDRPPPNMITAAAEIRMLVNKSWYYGRNAGLNMGFSDTYIPRGYDREKIIRDPQKFIQQAGKAYADQFDLALDGITKPNERQIKMRELAREAGIPVRSGQINEAQLRAAYAKARAEAWNQRVRVGDPDSFDALGPDTSFLHERELPPSADTHLAEFMNRDVRDVLHDYFHKLTARAEYVRRVGANNSDRLEKMITQAVNAGAFPQDIAQLRNLIQFVSGRTAANQVSEQVQSAESTIMYYGTLGLMTKAAFSSIGEPINTMLRTRSFRALTANLQGLMADAVNTTRGVDRAQLAYAIGSVMSQQTESIMLSRFNAEIGFNKTRGRKLSTYFMRNVLGPLTRWQRMGALAAAETYVRKLVETAATGKGEAARFAQYSLNELGIGSNMVPEMHAWLTDPARINGLKAEDVDVVEGSNANIHGRVVGRALNTVTRQLILSSQRIDKPELAMMPWVRMMYGLQSFTQSFARHFIARMWQEFKNSPGFAAKARYIMGALPGIAMVIATSIVVTALKKALFGADNPNATEDEKFWQFVWTSMSSANVFGAYDFIAQTLMGVAYQRSITQMLTGAQVGTFSTPAEILIRGLFSNSENTNTAERNRVKAIAQLAAPIISAGLIMLPGGRFVGPLTTGTIMWANSAAGRDWLASALYGPPTPKHKADPGAFGARAPRSRRSSGTSGRFAF